MPRERVMFESIQAALTVWGLLAASGLCFAGAVAAFIYVPVLGQWIAIVLVALGSALAAYDMGYSARGKLDNSGGLQAQLDERNRELEATQKIVSDAASRAQAAEERAAERETKINDYEKKLAAIPDVSCALSDSDMRSLRDIGGSSSSVSPSRSSGVRKASSSSKAHKR